MSISFNATYVFVSSTGLDPRGQKSEYTWFASGVHGTHRLSELVECQGVCARGDSREACVWAEDPKMGLWEKKPTSVGGWRQNCTFTAGSGEGALEITGSPSDPSLSFISPWKPEIAAG